MMSKLKFKGKAIGSSNASPYGLKDEALKNEKSGIAQMC